MCDRLIGAKGVSEALGCSQRQVWKLLASGRLPEAVRLGRSVRWRQSDIGVFIECGCRMDQFERAGAGAA